MSDPQDDKVSLWGIAWKVAAISFIVLCFGGLALRAYSVLRFNDPEKIVDCDWLLGLVIFGACGAVTFATLVVAWRLIHPEKPAWGVGVLVLCILLFGILVWPTPWTYREYGCKIFQINRLTGTRLEIATLPECPARKD